MVLCLRSTFSKGVPREERQEGMMCEVKMDVVYEQLRECI
jgi:hypothetical protein